MDGTVTVTTSGLLTVSTPGIYTLSYSATDAAWNTSRESRKVTVQDTIAPVITLSGSATMTHEAGTVYIDEGADAEDAVDGTVTVTTSGLVMEGIPGIYTLSYSATDSVGNTGTATRKVTVQDTVGPLITLSGSSTVSHEAGTAYSDEGAGAEDAVDGIVTVTTSGSVTEGNPGHLHAELQRD